MPPSGGRRTRVEVYSDIVCPWCYIGTRRFARALAAFPRSAEVEVIYRSYQLDPRAPGTPTPLLDALQEKFGPRTRDVVRHVADVARGEGIEIEWERAVSVNTSTAHRLLGLAGREYGSAVQRALAERLYDAHFSGGGNVADHGLLTELAASVGMDRMRVLDYLTSGGGASELRRELEVAQHLGVRAVPTFVLDGRYVIEGAQSVPTLLRALNEVAASTATGAGAGNSAAASADGGCT